MRTAWQSFPPWQLSGRMLWQSFSPWSLGVCYHAKSFSSGRSASLRCPPTEAIHGWLHPPPRPATQRERRVSGVTLIMWPWSDLDLALLARYTSMYISFYTQTATGIVIGHVIEVCVLSVSRSPECFCTPGTRKACGILRDKYFLLDLLSEMWQSQRRVGCFRLIAKFMLVRWNSYVWFKSCFEYFRFVVVQM